MPRRKTLKAGEYKYIRKRPYRAAVVDCMRKAQDANDCIGAFYHAGAKDRKGKWRQTIQEETLRPFLTMMKRFSDVIEECEDWLRRSKVQAEAMRPVATHVIEVERRAPEPPRERPLPPEVVEEEDMSAGDLL